VPDAYAITGHFDRAEASTFVFVTIGVMNEAFSTKTIGRGFAKET
jgi:hypothetical protein